MLHGNAGSVFEVPTDDRVAAFAGTPAPVVLQHDARREAARVGSGIETAARRRERVDTLVTRRAIGARRAQALRVSRAAR